MSLVNQFLSQTYLRCRCQPRSIKLTACITVAAFLTLVACVVGWQEAHSHEPLFASQEFSDTELSTIEAAFGTAGLSDYYITRGKIIVPRQQRAKFMEAIREAKAVRFGLDGQYQQELDRGSLLESQSQLKQRVKRANELRIAECLRAMPGIEEASVHFDEVELGGLRRERMVRAMVAIKTSVAGNLTVERVHGIRDLVSANNALLDPKDVTIVDLRTGRSYAGAPEQAAAQLHGDEFIRQKQQYEHEWREKVRAAVAFVPGAEVTTNVHLAQPDLRTTHRAESMLPAAISVSVGIPHSYYHRVRQQQGPRFPEATPDSAAMQRIEQETIDKVQQIVAGLLPPADEALRTRVVVTTFTDLTGESWGLKGIDFWLRRLRLNPTLLASVIGLVAMVAWLIRGLWRDLTAKHETPTIALANVDEPPSSEASRDAAEPKREQIVDSNEIVHRELTRLVREDPETAAEMLGEWVRKAG